jgi:hypothetical protein
MRCSNGDVPYQQEKFDGSVDSADGFFRVTGKWEKVANIPYLSYMNFPDNDGGSASLGDTREGEHDLSCGCRDDQPNSRIIGYKYDRDNEKYLNGVTFICDAYADRGEPYLSPRDISIPKPCSTGWYGVGSDILPVPAGFYQDQAGQTTYKECPTGTYSTGGAAECTACPTGEK